MIDLKGFKDELISQQLAERTIEDYCCSLRRLPKTKQAQKQFLIKNRNSRALIFAYRKYINYQWNAGLISSEEKDKQLNTFKPSKQRGTKQNAKWFKRNEWEELIVKAPHRCSKMGIWIGFNFGLRVGEIVNLRVQDIDLETDHIHIHVREDWHPKHYRNRSVPIALSQKDTLERWIKERPALDHPYLIYSAHNKQVTEWTFRRWCKIAHPKLKTHDLRRSFAQYLYDESGRDLKLVQLLLGHGNVGTTSTYLGIDTNEISERFNKAFG